jgi:hypothetical protein
MAPLQNKYRLGIGLTLLFFAAAFFVRPHPAGFDPADRYMILFLSFFGANFCIRAFARSSRARRWFRF